MRSRTGTIRIWNGTKLPATNMKKIQRFPRNLYTPRANPVMQLRATAPMTVGTVISTEFRR